MSKPTCRTSHLALALVAAFSGPLLAQDLVVPSVDFVTIQAAVDAAGEGDRIIILPGTYQENVVIDGKASLDVIGKKGATIDARGLAEAILVSSGDDIRVEGLTLVDASGYGLSLVNTSNSVIDGVMVAGATNSGISMNGGSGNLVSSCRVEDCFNGISFTGQAHLAIGNRIDDVVNDGFFVYGSGHVITGNTVNDADDNAVQIGNNNAAIRVLVERNTFSDLGGPAIVYGSAAESCILRANKITGGSQGVLLGSGASAITVEGNRFSKLGGEGLRVRSGATLIASGNSIRQAGSHGVLLEADAGECVLIGNVIVKSAQSGVRVEAGAAPARITGNRITKAGGAGFSIAADDCSLVLNRASKSTTFDLEDGGTGTVLQENAFATTSP